MGLLRDDYCVAYIDILGFKNMTNNVDKIKEFAPIITDAIERMKRINIENRYDLGETNIDNIIIQGADSLFVLFPNNFINSFVTIRRIMILQFILALKGVYIRGSINSGAMYIDTENEIYFGEAWNKAVLEESGAIYPRILLENIIAKQIEDSLKNINESVGEFYLDFDGNYVLDSYGIHPILDLREYTGYDEAIELLLTVLEENINTYKSNKIVLQKHLWIINCLIYRHPHKINLFQGYKDSILSYIKTIK